MTDETFLACTRQPKNIKYRLRSKARDTLLSILSAFCFTQRPSQGIRFLMAHYVFDDQRKLFEHQLKMLRNLGEFINTEDALSMCRGDVSVDGNYFHMSFDDGLGCLARNAAPLLNEEGIPALVFINSAVTGDSCPDERIAWEHATNYAKPLKVMSWDELLESGFEVGAHTRTHVRLSEISNNKDKLIEEVHRCKTDIEKYLSKPCRYFAWPFGQCTDIDRLSLDAIKEAGYEAAFGAFRAPVKPGNLDLFMIPRHHFEPQWPCEHVRYFALGGGESWSLGS